MQFETNPSAQTIKNYNDKEEGVDVANSEAYGSKSEYGANGSKGPCGYLWRKYLDIQEYKYNNAFGTSSVCVLSYPLMRLAELYLIRAEANIEWNGGDLSVAKADIETIRSRAHMPGLGENLSRDGLRSALRYERMVELCNEGFRWFDIRRLWNDPLFQDDKKNYTHKVGEQTYTLTEDRLTYRIPPKVMSFNSGWVDNN